MDRNERIRDIARRVAAGLPETAGASGDVRRIPYVVYAVDFDNTLARSKYPHILGPIEPAIAFVRRIQDDPGSRWILWTCREGDRLREAVNWCASQGLFPDAVNENLPEPCEVFGADSRKIFADFYIDDKSVVPETDGAVVLPKRNRL